jgi:uncharacterized protein with HEPN domain
LIEVGVGPELIVRVFVSLMGPDPGHDPAGSLTEMIDNDRRIEGCPAGMDRATFVGSSLIRDAVARCLERVREAAHRLGKQATELMPG